MHKNSLISICIPTCNRPELLLQAIQSCAQQDYLNFEIVIGDDSAIDASAQVVSNLGERLRERVQYRRNAPPLGQNANVNELFKRANGDRLLLLHDDDLLMPNALSALASCWEREPNLSAAFGKQYVIDANGNILAKQSEDLNEKYNRTSNNRGIQVIPAVAGISRMFPNNGYLVRTDLARLIGYRPKEEIGDACDFDFGLRLCLAATAIWFVDEYVSKWRIWDVQMSKQALPAPYTYELLSTTPVPAEAEAQRKIALRQIAPIATSGLARSGSPNRALAILLSPDYTWRDKVKPRCMYHLVLIGAAFVCKVVSPGLRGKPSNSRP